MATVSLRLAEKENELIRAYTNFHGITISDFAREAMLTRIEDEIDLQDLERAILESKNKKFYTLSETKKKLGL